MPPSDFRQIVSNPIRGAKSTFSSITEKVDFFYMRPTFLDGKAFPVS